MSNWYGTLPERWGSHRIKTLFSLRDERNFEPLSKVRLLSLYTAIGVKPHDEIERVAGNVAVTADNYKKVYENDIVVNIILCWQGAIGLSKWNGVTSPAYDVYRAISDDVNVDYFNYLFRTPMFSGECYKAGRGIMAMRWRTYSDEFTAINVPIPPRSEQDQIVRFLDWKVSGVNRLINAKKKQIVLLGEQKRAVVNEAVTRGGDGWSTSRFRFLCKITTGNKDTVNREDNGAYPFYVRSPKIERINSYSYDGEAILMAGDGVGAGRVFHYVNGKFDFHQRVYCFYDFSELLHVPFLHYYMSALFPLVVDKGTAKSTVDSIRLNMIQDFVVQFPNISKQQEIVCYLDKQCSAIDTITDKINAEIALLHEYRTRLVSDVVTGKMDVRGVDVPVCEVVGYEVDVEDVEMGEDVE